MRLRKPSAKRSVRAERGFSVVELLIVLAIALVVAAFAIPGYQSMVRFLRISGDARALNGLVAQAKMRAAADFTRARVYGDLAGNTYHLELWNKTGNGGAGCWQTDGDTANACTVAGTSPVIQLSPGVAFGLNGVGAGAPNPQATAAQADLCDNGTGGTYGNTACVVFNSRGVPCNAAGKPILGAKDALYVTDTNTVWGVTVLSSGLIQLWSSNASQTSWHPR